MSAADQKVERLADKLQEFADRSAAEGGMKAKLAQPLADDAAFVRKLKPSLIKARARGRAPTDAPPAAGAVAPPATDGSTAPAPPKRVARPKQRRAGKSGPNPWLVAGACLAAGILVAKWIDWRGHAHPRD